jgi:DNA-binding HxlR family transcriptional regulator
METNNLPAEMRKRDGLNDANDELAREVVGCVLEKWSLTTMHVLAVGGPLRFSRIEAQVEGVSQKMLTKTLRHLERDGLVTRTMYLEVPPRVEYAITDFGKELLRHLGPLWAWIAENVVAFQTARERFDRAAKR